jgi:Ca-activated chloride channel family protein
MEKRLIIIFIVPFLLYWHWFEPAAKKNLAGIKANQEKQYDEALKQFLSARGIEPNLPGLKSNTASTLYELEKYKEALEEFSTIDPEKVEIPKADFYYNLGNSFFRLNRFDKALESYKRSLVLNSRDMIKIKIKIKIKKKIGKTRISSSSSNNNNNNRSKRSKSIKISCSTWTRMRRNK